MTVEQGLGMLFVGVVAITIGEEKAQETVRKALAVGADRGIHVKAESNIEPLSVEKIDNIIKEKKTIYDLKVDQRVSKFNKGQKLTTIDLKLLPNYIQNNIEKYKLWLD